jgi:hypothetical protein
MRIERTDYTISIRGSSANSEPTHVPVIIVDVIHTDRMVVNYTPSFFDDFPSFNTTDDYEANERRIRLRREIDEARRRGLDGYFGPAPRPPRVSRPEIRARCFAVMHRRVRPWRIKRKRA